MGCTTCTVPYKTLYHRTFYHENWEILGQGLSYSDNLTLTEGACKNYLVKMLVKVMFISSHFSPNPKNETTFFSSIFKVEIAKVPLDLESELKWPRYEHLFTPPYWATIFLPQIPLKLRCSYLGHFGSDLKSNGTFALSTLKIEEKKWSYFLDQGWNDWDMSTPFKSIFTR